MKKENFIQKFGVQETKTSAKFISKCLKTNLTIYDGINELIDNSIDSRIENEECVIEIKYDSKNNTITFTDNGKGIPSDVNPFDLGYSNKTNNEIGKFGSGIKNALSIFYFDCIKNDDEMMECSIETFHEGKKYNRHAGIYKDEYIQGNLFQEECDSIKHGTTIKITNFIFGEKKFKQSLIDKIRKTYGLTLKYLNIKISINIDGETRYIEDSENDIFLNEEFITEKQCKVAGYNVTVRYGIVNGSRGSEDRSFDKSGLRIFNENGRMLDDSTDLWKSFVGRGAQPTICGVRCAIFIESNSCCFDKFGISFGKNRIKREKFYENEDFKELKSILSNVYITSANNKNKDNDNIINYRGFKFLKDEKEEKLYSEYGHFIGVKKKYNNKEIYDLILENIELKKEICSNNKREIEYAM